MGFFDEIHKQMDKENGSSMSGEIAFTDTPQEMADHADTIIAKYLSKSLKD